MIAFSFFYFTQTYFKVQIGQASIAQVYQKLDWNVYIDFIPEMYMHISYSYTELSKFYYTFGKQYIYIYERLAKRC